MRGSAEPPSRRSTGVEPVHRRWSIRVLRERIQSMLFERTALSRKPEELIKKELSALRESGELMPDMVMRDPYMLPFLGVADTYSESDLEAAFLREI